MQTCCRNTLVRNKSFSSWLSLWRTGGQGHHGPVGGPSKNIQHPGQVPRKASIYKGQVPGGQLPPDKFQIGQVPPGCTFLNPAAEGRTETLQMTYIPQMSAEYI